MLQKRVFDDRIFEVDLSPVMRSNDTVSVITSIEANPEGDGAAVTIGNNTIIEEGRGVSFTGAGGSDRSDYEIVIRFTTAGAVAQTLEGVIGLRVKD